MSGTPLHRNAPVDLLRLCAETTWLEEIQQDGSHLPIAESLTEIGQAKPLLVWWDPDTRLACLGDGHHRLVAMRHLGWIHARTTIYPYAHPILRSHGYHTTWEIWEWLPKVNT